MSEENNEEIVIVTIDQNSVVTFKVEGVKRTFLHRYHKTSYRQTWRDNRARSHQTIQARNKNPAKGHNTGMNSTAAELRIHSFLPTSQANGPGLRSVLWLQGCSLACPGCFNPETHAFNAGTVTPVTQVFDWIEQLCQDTEGLTISGGEPLFQIRPLIKLLQLVRKHTGLSTLLFTGFTIEEAVKMPNFKELSCCLDVIIAGRYKEDQRLARNLIASSNKTIQFYTDRYADQDFQDIPQSEIFINEDGEIIATGINPLLVKQGAK